MANTPEKRGLTIKELILQYIPLGNIVIYKNNKVVGRVNHSRDKLNLMIVDANKMRDFPVESKLQEAIFKETKYRLGNNWNSISIIIEDEESNE